MRTVVCSMAIMLITVATLPATSEDLNLMDMSLDDILNTVVVSAAKQEQTVENAPAIIDVISERQIRDFGATNLYDLIASLPGIEIMETYFGRTVLQFRGIMNLHYTNKVLLLVNGAPMYEPVNGSYLLELIPTVSIKQIEIIRGPGSSLYGTNAYSGVINIITKNPTQETSAVSATAGYGSFATLHAAASANLRIAPGSGIHISGEVIDGDGYEFNVDADEKGFSETLDYRNDNVKVYGNYFHRGLSIHAGTLNQKKQVYGLTPVLAYAGLAERNILFANAAYAFDLTDALHASLSTRYFRYETPDHSIGSFPVPGFGGHDTSDVYLKLGGYTTNFELQLDYRLSPQLSNTSGVVYETAASDKYQFLWRDDGTAHPFSAFLHEPDSYTISGYTQFQYRPVRTFQAIGGLRVVKNKDVEDAFLSPRAGAILGLGECWFIKALYGQAFRTPDFFEKYVETANVLFGSVDLDPEKIETIDVGIEGNRGTFKTRLNGFLERTKDGITRIPTPTPDEHGPGATVYVNSAELRLYGIEYSVNGVIPDKGYVGFNLGWKRGESTETDEALMYLAEVTANGWLNYELFPPVMVTPHVNYVGARKGTSGDGDYELAPYVLLNLSCRWRLPRGWSVQVTGRNLADEDYTYPEYIRENIDDIPGGAGRSIYAAISYER